MPTTAKRRKLAVPNQHVKGGISSFTTVSKATTAVKVVLEKNHRVDKIILAPSKEQPPNVRKRKAADEEEAVAPPAPAENWTIKQPEKNPTLIRTSPHTSRLRTSHQLPNIPTKKLTKSARNSSNEQSSPKNNPQSLSPRDSDKFYSSIEASTPKTLLKSPEHLPDELLDLIDLYASFLTTLSIHFAHNGRDSPADLGSLCPNMARSWGKRKVTKDDVRRLLGISNSKNHTIEISRMSMFTLSDYGKGKICVEVQSTLDAARPINEDLMNSLFVAEVDHLWNARNEPTSVLAFIDSLPLETIQVNSSLTKISPMLAKGQQRLDYLRTDLAARRDEKQQQIEAKGKIALKTSLLERLRAKQLLSSSLAPGLTKEQIARRGALSRIDEVVAVLAILSTSGSLGQSRVSFTMPTVLAKLKDSFRTPISVEEGDACLRLLATEVAPEWVRIAKMGKVEALIVNRETRLTEGAVKERVRKLQEI